MSATGFSDFSQPDAVTNMALWDMTLALQWVHDNAHCFGAGGMECWRKDDYLIGTLTAF